MFQMKLHCTTHNSPVISAEATLEAEIAPFVFVKDGEVWTLDEGNLYCVGGVDEHKFVVTLSDTDGNYLAGER